MTTKLNPSFFQILKSVVLSIVAMVFLYNVFLDKFIDRKLRNWRNSTRETEIQQAISNGDFKRARKRAAEYSQYDQKKGKAYDDITRAEVSFLVNSGKIDQAYNIALEQKSTDMFLDAFMPALIDVYKEVGKIKLLQYLVKVEMRVAPDLSESHISTPSHTLIGNKCGFYNESAIKYNSLLEQFILYIDILGDRDFATQLLRFVKPIVVELPMNGDKWTGVKLSEHPREDMKKKLGL